MRTLVDGREEMMFMASEAMMFIASPTFILAHNFQTCQLISHTERRV